MQITLEQLQELERHHGKGIVVLSVGDDDFAFRRPTDAEVSYSLGEQSAGAVRFLENLALRCAVCPAAPRAGQPVKNGADGKPLPDGLSGDEKTALSDEKGRLEALWADAQEFRDSIPALFSLSCGGNPDVQSSSSGADRYAVVVSSNPAVRDEIEPWTFSVIARRPNAMHFDEYRKREALGSEGDSQRYLWDKLVESPEKAEFARLYPFAVVAAGRELARLGVNGRSVRVKKFDSGQAPEPGSSGSTSPGLGISG
jgi:hypothetical protein